jgi:tryptophan synthase beta chain
MGWTPVSTRRRSTADGPACCTATALTEHAFLHDVGRVTYLSATDAETVEAFQLLSRLEGILPALESAHALARLGDIAKDVGEDGIIVVNLSGRGDKDLETVAARLGAST